MNDTPVPTPPPASNLPKPQTEDKAPASVVKPAPSNVPRPVAPPTVNQPPINNAPPKPPQPVGIAPLPSVTNLPPTPLPKPPTTLSALSSMNSNKLPADAKAQAGQPPLPPKPGGLPQVPSNQPPKPAVAAAPKKSILRFLPFIIGGLLIIGLIIFLFTRFFGGNRTNTPSTGNGGTTPTQSVTLEYWGLWEPNEVLTSVLQEFEAQNPGVTVNYTKQSHIDYRERLQTAIASGNGPDLFRFHATWTPMLKQELAPMPSSVMSMADYQKTFYPVATKQLQSNGQIVGIPLMYDGLALYYNTDMFRTANVQPPQTWAELRTIASQLTVRAEGRIQRGGLAIGNSINVEHFADILGLLMLQNGADLSKPNSAEARDAMLFYTNFIKADSVWSPDLPSSTVAFARGEAAMMFAPSWRVHEIKALNPSLQFNVAPVPQLADKKVGWATYWAEGVNVKNKNTQQAWKLLQYMSSADTLKKLHAEQSTVRAFGELYPRTDMANELANTQYVGAFLKDAPVADGGFMSTYTHDKGINDLIIKYYSDAVSAVLSGSSPQDTLLTVDQGTTQVLRQYNAQ